jgi:hypothetical protein
VEFVFSHRCDRAGIIDVSWPPVGIVGKGGEQKAHAFRVQKVLMRIKPDPRICENREISRDTMVEKGKRAQQVGLRPCKNFRIKKQFMDSYSSFVT